MKQIILSIDSSGTKCCCSLFRSEKLAARASSADSSYNEEIDSLVAAVLKEAGISSESLTTLIVGAGPGSFTGLRIGFAYTKGLSLALGIPLFTYSAMEAIPYAVAPDADGGQVVCLADAGRGELFFSAHKISSGRVSCLLAPHICTPESVKIFLDGADNKTLIFRPDGLKHWPEDAYPGQVFPAPSSALVSMHLSLTADSDPAQTPGLHELSPLYLRQVAAKSLQDRGIPRPRI